MGDDTIYSNCNESLNSPVYSSVVGRRKQLWVVGVVMMIIEL